MIMKRLLNGTLVAAGLLLGTGLQAEETNAAAPADKLSYSIGVSVGTGIRAQLQGRSFEVDPDVVAQGFKDALTGTPAMTPQEAQGIIVAYQEELRAKAVAEAQAMARTNRESGAAFLAENAKKEGVKTTTSGLQYKVLTEGDGEIPRENHTVTVNYRGTLIDGTEFDSSYKRGQPWSTDVKRVIPGWTEALLMMPVGSKWQLFIPADLAYADRPQGKEIPPGSTLIFEIELLDTKGPQPIVSDIIKVPSADEMKKGAKIETLKPEDVERLKAEQNKK